MKRLIVVLVAVAAALGIGRTALADHAGHWPLEWEPAQGQVDYFAANDDAAPFNTATADSEMGLARNTWNNVSGAPDTIDYGGTTGMSGIACSASGLSSVTDGRVYAKGCSIPSSGAAYGLVINNSVIRKGLILMDSTPSGFTWHISSSTTVPAGKKDLRGAVAHEIGHMLGGSQSHIEIGDCETAGAQTMCTSHSTGTSKYRSAQAHEVQDWKDQNNNVSH